MTYIISTKVLYRGGGKYSSTHQWRGIDKGDFLGNMESTQRIRNHVLGEPAIHSQSQGLLFPLTVNISLLIILTVRTDTYPSLLGTRPQSQTTGAGGEGDHTAWMIVIQCAHSIADFESRAINVRTHCLDHPNGLMTPCDGQLGASMERHAINHLDLPLIPKTLQGGGGEYIGMTETRRVDFDEEVPSRGFRHRDLP